MRVKRPCIQEVLFLCVLCSQLTTLLVLAVVPDRTPPGDPTPIGTYSAYTPTQRISYTLVIAEVAGKFTSTWINDRTGIVEYTGVWAKCEKGWLETYTLPGNMCEPRVWTRSENGWTGINSWTLEAVQCK